MHCNSNSLQLQSEEEFYLQDCLHCQETLRLQLAGVQWVFCVLCETWRRSPCFSRKCSAASWLLYSPDWAAAVEELTRPAAYQSVSGIHSSYLALCAALQSCGRAVVRPNCWGNLASPVPLVNTIILCNCSRLVDLCYPVLLCGVLTPSVSGGLKLRQSEQWCTPPTVRPVHGSNRLLKLARARWSLLSQSYSRLTLQQLLQLQHSAVILLARARRYILTNIAARKLTFNFDKRLEVYYVDGIR